MSKKPIPDKINNYEEYNELLERITKAAKYIDEELENPLKRDERSKMMWFYDKMCRVAREYRTSEV